MDPPARLDGAVLHVLGQLQHLQPGLCVVEQAEHPPQGEDQLVQQAPSAVTNTDAVLTHTTRGAGASPWDQVLLGMDYMWTLWVKMMVSFIHYINDHSLAQNTRLRLVYDSLN